MAMKAYPMAGWQCDGVLSVAEEAERSILGRKSKCRKNVRTFVSARFIVLRDPARAEWQSVGIACVYTLAPDDVASQHTTRGMTVTFLRMISRASCGFVALWLASTGAASNVASGKDDHFQSRPVAAPEALRKSDREEVLQQIERSYYRFEERQDSVFGANPKQGWQLLVNALGLSLTTPLGEDSADANLHLQTVSVGRDQRITQVGATTSLVRTASRVELRHGNVTEWYENGSLGLEHGYTFGAKPAGHGDVRIVLAVAGGFKAQQDGENIRFVRDQQRISYRKLSVIDAEQKPLDARMQVTADQRIEIAFDDTRARYPVVVDPLLVNEEAKVTAADGGTEEFFGRSAISGDTLVVGAVHDTINGQLRHGSAYVFVRTASGWTQQAKLIPSQGGFDDRCGGVVAIDGDTAVVNCPLDDDPLFDQGSAYVFVRNGTTWTEQQKLRIADGQSSSQLGYSVGLSGDTVVLGAKFHDAGVSNSGAAYVFVRTGTTWTQQAMLTASDRRADDRFGQAASISGDTAVIGAFKADVGSRVDQGSAYVFVRSGTRWTQQAKLVATDGTADDVFGVSAAISGNTALVGARVGDLRPSIDQNRGAAYVFTRSGTTWTQQAKLVAADAEPGDSFGGTVALDRDTAVIGADLDDIDGNANQGSAYIFTRSGTTWTQDAKLTEAGGGSAGDGFGQGVAIFDSTVVVAVRGDDTPQGTDAGSAIIYRVKSELDYGDAPSPSYPTLLASDGARHFIGALRLGAQRDPESDGQPNSGATGDDIAGIDDEDGVNFGTLVPGQTGRLSLEVSDGPGLVDAWVDFNRDGDWSDPGEHIFDDVFAANGANNLTFAVPASAVPGTSFARVRLSSNNVESFTGVSPDGEVEDEQVTIQNISLNVSDAQVVEGNSGTTLANVVVSLSAPSTERVTGRLRTSDGTARISSDYLSRSGDISFAPGQTSRVVSITVNGDTMVEPDETFFVTISGVVNATINDGQGAVTIVNDDAPLRTLSINDTSVAEGNAGSRNAVFTVTLSAAATRPVTVSFATANGTATAGSDYSAVSGTVSIPTGSRTAVINVPVTGDTVVEPNETLFVNLSAPSGASLADAQGVATISNDDAVGAVAGIGVNVTSFNFGNVPVGSTSVQRMLIISSTGSAPLRISSVRLAGDYVGSSGCPASLEPGATCVLTGNFKPTAAGARPGSVTILSNAPTSPTVVQLMGTGTATSPKPALSITREVTVVEPLPEEAPDERFATFEVRLSSPATSTVSVDYFTQDAEHFSDADSATPGSDYVAAAGTLEFSAGEVSKTISIKIIRDLTIERYDEEFSVVLRNVTGNASLPNDTAGFALIIDVDLDLSLSIKVSDVVVSENSDGRKQAVFYITGVTGQGRDAFGNFNFVFSTSGGTAAPGIDYAEVTNSPGFIGDTNFLGAGAVDILDDNLLESDETFFVTISAARSGVKFGRAKVTIVSDDQLPFSSILSISDSRVIRFPDCCSDEPDQLAEFVVTRVGKTDIAQTVIAETQDGSASAGVGYMSRTEVINFAPGETAKIFTVPVSIAGFSSFFYVNLRDSADAFIVDSQAAGAVDTFR